MKRILLFVFALAMLSNANAQLTSSTALTTGVTTYTNGQPDDPMFFYCTGQTGSLTATPASGTPGWDFQWQSFSPVTSSWTNTTLDSNLPTSTISNLAPGAYRAIITDGTGAEVGRYIGWIMRVNTLPSINVNPIASGCGNVNLSGTFTAGTATPYYNIPPDPDPNSLLYIDADTEITVCYTGTHTNISDLRFQLVAPSSCGAQLITLALNPSPSNCNQGDNFTSLCFSTESSNIFNVCTMAVPLTGTFGAYNTSSGALNIDWSPLYGCLANQTGWSIQVLDCQGQNTGQLQSASISFTGLNVGGSSTTVTYAGTAAAGQIVTGALNTNQGGFIFDNTCTSAASTKYLVTNVAPPINLTQTYAWSASPAVTITNSTSLTATVNPGPIADTQFTLSLTGNFPVGICGFSGSDTELYDYTNSAVPVIAPVNPQYCIGDAPFNLSADLTGGTWSGVGITSPSLGTFNPAIAGVGPHVISYTLSGSCITVVNTTINVIQATTPTLTNPGSLCTGGATVNLVSSILGGVWSGQGITNPNTGAFDPAISGDGDWVISYALTSPCPVSQTMSIHVDETANATIDEVGDVCDTGGVITLTAAQGGGQWSGTGITNMTTGTFNPANANVGLNVITYTISGACGASDTEEINVVSLENLDITEVGPFCADDAAIQLQTNTPGGSWSGTGVSSTGLFTPGNANSGTNTITYSLTGFCPATETTAIVVNALPAVNAGVNQDVCPGGSVNITASGANSYQWSPSTYITSATNGATISTTPGATITYTVEGTNAAGCTNTDQVTVVLNPAASITAAPAYQICEGGQVSLAVSGASSYSWTPAGSLFGPNSSAPIASPAVTTTYTVVGTDANGCTDSEQVTVTVVQINVAIDVTPNIGDLPLNVIFEGISNGDTFNWNFGEGTLEVSSDITDIFEIIYSEAGIYTATITANLDGCSETASAEIIVLTGLPLLIPDVITPNGDGLNDVFTIRRGELETFNIDIYDRWGKKVGSINEIADEWKPGDADAGTYYYIMTGTTFARKEMVQEGSFILLNE